MLKNWCFWTVVLEKTLESPLDCKEIQPVHPKGNQSWIFIGRTGAEAEAPILWPPDVRNWLTGKDPHAGKDWGQEEKAATEEEIVGRHHWLSEHEFEQTPGDSEGQRSLVCCSPWGCTVQQDLVSEQENFYASITLSWLLLLCSKFWNWEVWIFQLFSSFSRLFDYLGFPEFLREF